MVCNDESSSSVSPLHGMDHALRGLKGPLWVLKVVIVSRVALANVASLSRAFCARPMEGAMSCAWPAVAVCLSRRRPRSSVGISLGGFRSKIEPVPLSEWEERGVYAHAWVKREWRMFTSISSLVRSAAVWSMDVWVATVAAKALTSVAAISLTCLAMGHGVQRARRTVSRRSVPPARGWSEGGAKCGAHEVQIASASY